MTLEETPNFSHTKNLKRCTRAELEILCNISRQTFSETFAQSNTDDDMKRYLNQAYSPEMLGAQLDHPESEFYLLWFNSRPVGYLKLNDTRAQTEFNDENALEIERIYLLREFQGHGLGSMMLNYAQDLALSRGKTYLFLGVWEKNENALQFYRKHGFYRIGEHTFIVGADRQTDYLMHKNLQ